MPGEVYRDKLILVVGAEYASGAQNPMKLLSDLERRVEALNKQVSTHANSLFTAAKAADTNAAAVTRSSVAAGRASRSNRRLGGDLVQTSHSFRRMTASLATGNMALDTLSLRLDKASMFMWRFNIAMIPLQQIEFQLAAITGGMIMLERGAIQVYRQAERMKNTFIGMGDSEEVAAQKIDFLLEKAKTLPFTFDQISSAAMAFMVSGTTKSLSELDRWLNAAADMAAAATTEQGRDIARAAEAMIDAVNGEIRRMRNTYHVSMEEIKSHGDNIREALLKTIDVKWGGVAQKQMATLEGSISNFMDSLTRLGIVIGENLSGPLSTLLGIGTKFVETLTAMAKALGSVGTSAVVIATLGGLLGILASRIMITYVQINGLRGAYRILTRDVGNLFTVMAQLAEAMGRQAQMEADMIARTGMLNKLVAQQSSLRRTLVGDILAEASAYEVLDAATMKAYLRAPMKFEGAATVMSRPAGVARAAFPGKSNLNTSYLANMAAGVPPAVYTEYLNRTKKSLEQLTAAEHALLLEQSKRAGILVEESAATAASTAATKSRAASEEVYAAAAARTVLLQERMAQYSLSNIGRSIARAFTPVQTGLTGISGLAARLSSGFMSLRLAMHSTVGASFALTGAIGAVMFAITSISKQIADDKELIEQHAQAEKSRVDQLEAEGVITKEAAEAARRRNEEMEEQAERSQKRLYGINIAKRLLSLVTFGALTRTRFYREWGQKELTDIIEASNPVETPTLSRSIRRDIERAPQGGATTRELAGRRFTLSDIQRAIGMLPERSPYTEFVRPSALRTRIEELEVEIHSMERAQKQYGATAAQLDELDRKRREHAMLVAQEARAQQAVAVYLGREDDLLQAERREIEALNTVRQTEISLLGREQNRLDSYLGYLRQIGGSLEEQASVLQRLANVHALLAERYRKGGDEARYWQERLAAVRLIEQARLTTADAELAAMDNKITRMQLMGKAAWELYQAELLRFQLAMRRAGLMGKEEEREQAQLEAMQRAQTAYQNYMDERAAVAGAIASREELMYRLRGGETPLLDPRVLAARRAAAYASVQSAAAQHSRSGLLQALNSILEIELERRDAAKRAAEDREREQEEAKEELRNAQDAYYEWSKAALQGKFITQEQADIIKRQYMGILRQRIREEDNLAEKIRLQTELIRIQADEAKRGYDDIIRRIIGGPEAVDEAISMQMLARRFGPIGLSSTSDSVRVLNRSRNTLTIELSSNTASRLREAVSGAASEAFIRSFIEEIVTRLRS